mgnify:CR=1 FL=1
MISRGDEELFSLESLEKSPIETKLLDKFLSTYMLENTSQIRINENLLSYSKMMYKYYATHKIPGSTVLKDKLSKFIKIINYTNIQIKNNKMPAIVNCIKAFIFFLMLKLQGQLHLRCKGYGMI